MLGLQDRIGNFTVGKEFDALVVDAAAAGILVLLGSLFRFTCKMTAGRHSLFEYTVPWMVAGGNVEIYEHDCLEDHFQKFLTLGDDRNIEQVYVRGRRVL